MQQAAPVESVTPQKKTRVKKVDAMIGSGSLTLSFIKNDFKTGYLYPNRAELLDRRVLVRDLRRLERKLLALSKRSLELEKANSVVSELRERQTVERRLKLRMETAVVSTYTRLAMALSEYEGNPADESSAELWLEGALRGEEARFAQAEITGSLARNKSCTSLRTPLVEEAYVSAAARSSAVISVGNTLSDRLVAALRKSIEARRIATSIETQDELRRREELRTDDRERRIRELTEQVGRLEGRLDDAERRNRDLQGKLHRANGSSPAKQNRGLDSNAQDRELRNSALDLVANLTAAYKRRLGFMPHDIRKDIDDFLSFLADSKGLHDDGFADDVSEDVEPLPIEGVTVAINEPA